MPRLSPYATRFLIAASCSALGACTTTTGPSVRSASQPAGLRQDALPAGGGAPVSGGRGTVTGRVVDSAGSPVAEVTVLTSPETSTTQTDATGTYTLANVPYGSYTLRVHAGAGRTAEARVDVDKASTVVDDIAFDSPTGDDAGKRSLGVGGRN